jgi:hypothetical protein
LLSVKCRHLFSFEVKTGPIYGMETNIKSGNGWLNKLSWYLVAMYSGERRQV